MRRELWLAILLVGCGSTTPVDRRSPPAPSATPRTAMTAPADAVQSVGSAAMPSAPSPAPRVVTPLDTSVTQRIDAVVKAALTEGQCPGAVVAVVRPQGVAFRRAYGARQLQPTREPMAESDTFDLASLTKPLATSAAVLRLVDQGKMKLDAPVSTYRPSFAQPGKPEVTVAQLLDHTSGLPAANHLRDFAGSREEALAKIDALPLRGVGKHRYSDVGYIVLGSLVAAVTERPLSTAVQTLVLEPLGMTGAAFGAMAGATAVPTERRDGHWLRGEVHDPRAAALDGVAGHAGLFGRADDVAAYVRMLLRRGEGPDERFWSEATWRLTQAPRGDGRQTLTFTRPMGGWGHTGFTGTMFWVEPRGQLGVVLLTSRLHPEGKGDVTKLRQNLRRIVFDAAKASVRTGADRWADVLAGKADAVEARPTGTIGLLTNHTGRTEDGRRLIDVLHQAPGAKLGAIFTPEHGIDGDVDAAVKDGRDAKTGVKVYSLYGTRDRPAPAQLTGIDTLVFDVQDVGVRFYTYITTLKYLLETAAQHGKRVVVLDRPNPLGLQVVDGPVLDDGLRSFIGPHALPIQHGMTVGELAKLFVAELQLKVELSVVTVDGYRGAPWPSTGLSWRPPSPNLPTLTSAQLYPAIGLLEASNLSVGRGTDAPFSVVGAPWVDSEKLHDELTKLSPAGVRFAVTRFTPVVNAFAGKVCHGLRFEVVDESAFRPVQLGMAIAVALRATHAGWRPASMRRHLGDAATYDTLVKGAPLASVTKGWAEELTAFAARRKPHLLYPR